LSPTLSFASSQSLRHHSTTHWPHGKTATGSSKHFGSRTPPCGSRNYQSSVPRCPSTAIHLPGDLGRTFKLLYGSKCSSPSMISRTKAQKQRRIWPHSVLCGRTAGGLTHLGKVLPVLSALQSLAQHIHSIGRIYTPGSSISARTHRPRGALSDVSGLQIPTHCSRTFHPMTRSRPSRTPQPTPRYATY
jgi:hypothetical protein